MHHLSLSLLLPRSPLLPLFPYTTLFRSSVAPPLRRPHVRCGVTGRSKAGSPGSAHRPRLLRPAEHRIPASLLPPALVLDRKSTRLNSSHLVISYAVFGLKQKQDHVSLTL